MPFFILPIASECPPNIFIPELELKSNWIYPHEFAPWRVAKKFLVKSSRYAHVTCDNGEAGALGS
jgi:hypothetical protein